MKTRITQLIKTAGGVCWYKCFNVSAYYSISLMFLCGTTIELVELIQYHNRPLIVEKKVNNVKMNILMRINPKKLGI